METIVIGDQEWMTLNLNVDRFLNGAIIPQALTIEEWVKAGKECRPVWCCYDNDPENDKKYGKLYNWYAVNDARGLAPKDWHIPSYAELKELVKEVKQDSNSLKLVDQDAISTNNSGFSALLAGVRYENAVFHGLGAHASFWSASDYNKFNAYAMSLHFEEFEIKLIDESKDYAFSVRCLKNYFSQKTTNILFKSHRIGQ